MQRRQDALYAWTTLHLRRRPSLRRILGTVNHKLRLRNRGNHSVRRYIIPSSAPHHDFIILTTTSSQLQVSCDVSITAALGTTRWCRCTRSRRRATMMCDQRRQCIAGSGCLHSGRWALHSHLKALNCAAQCRPLQLLHKWCEAPLHAPVQAAILMNSRPDKEAVVNSATVVVCAGHAEANIVAGRCFTY